jgi:hypothetical protein
MPLSTRRTLMSRTRQAPQARPEGARISDDRGRRWYHLRPKPRRGIDFIGFNSTWWMPLGWLVLLIVVAFPFPWWW